MRAHYKDTLFIISGPRMECISTFVHNSFLEKYFNIIEIGNDAGFERLNLDEITKFTNDNNPFTINILIRMHGQVTPDNYQFIKSENIEKNDTSL